MTKERSAVWTLVSQRAQTPELRQASLPSIPTSSYPTALLPSRPSPVQNTLHAPDLSFCESCSCTWDVWLQKLTGDPIPLMAGTLPPSFPPHRLRQQGSFLPSIAGFSGSPSLPPDESATTSAFTTHGSRNVSATLPPPPSDLLDLPVLDASAYPRKPGQLWADLSAPSTVKGRRAKRRPARAALRAMELMDSSTVPDLEKGPSSSSSNLDPESPTSPRRLSHGKSGKPEETSHDLELGSSVDEPSDPHSLGSFPLLFRFLQDELATVSARRPGQSYNCTSSDSDSPPSDGPKRPERKGRFARRSRKKHDVFSLPSFSDLAVPRPSPIAESRTRTKSSPSSTLLQLRAAQEKLAEEYPKEKAALSAAVECEGRFLEDGVPKSLRDDLEEARLNAQSGPSSASQVHVFVDQ